MYSFKYFEVKISFSSWNFMWYFLSIQQKRLMGMPEKFAYLSRDWSVGWDWRTNLYSIPPYTWGYWLDTPDRRFSCISPVRDWRPALMLDDLELAGTNPEGGKRKSKTRIQFLIFFAFSAQVGAAFVWLSINWWWFWQVLRANAFQTSTFTGVERSGGVGWKTEDLLQGGRDYCSWEVT